MTRFQILTVALAIGLFLVLFLGFDTKPPDQKAIERNRILTSEQTDILSLLKEAKENLTSQENGTITAYEESLKNAGNDSAKVEVLKEISGRWYRLGRPDISGHYAQEVAAVLGTEEAWSITGTTFTLCLQKMEDPKVRDFCSKRGVEAFENAISINPEEVNHRVNLAIVYTNQPPQDNPMKGILMLRELADKYPDNTLVLENLGRLAIQTGQYQKARERLEKAMELEPGNRVVTCLLAQVYEALEETKLAEDFRNQCESI